MRIDKEIIKDLTEDEIIFVQNRTFTDELTIDTGIYVRDYTDEECESDEFYLFAYGKYAKKIRQLFNTLEDDLRNGTI